MFSRLFLIGSFSYLQVMRTYIKAYTSLNFGQIPPLTTELAAFERLKNRCYHVISVDIDPIFFKLAGNKNMHNIMNEFEFRPDRTTDYRVSCPLASKKYPYRPYNGENGVSTFSLLFLIGSFWYFHVTRTSIKSWMSLNFLKWDLTLAHLTQVSDCCPLGYLLEILKKWPVLKKANSVYMCRTGFKNGGLRKPPLTENGGLSERPLMRKLGDFGAKNNKGTYIVFKTRVFLI